MSAMLIRCLAIGLMTTLAGPTHGQGKHCRQIADPKARLECFDAGPSPTASPRVASQAPNAQPASGSGEWVLETKKDAMTDKVFCVVIPEGKPFIQVNIGSLYISFRGRGGVEGFQFRIDDGPVSQMKFPDRIEKQVGVVHINGAPFEQILGAKRLRVQTVTILSSSVTEDIDLGGLAAVYAQMQRDCPR
jgi:hypothetical protein